MTFISGNVICKDCKFFRKNRSVDWAGKCRLIKKEISFNYVNGETIVNDDVYLNPQIKNRNGECPDYMPLDLGERLDFLLEQGRVALEEDLDEINNEYKCFISTPMWIRGLGLLFAGVL